MFGNVAAPTSEACGDPVGPGQFRSLCGVAPGSNGEADAITLAPLAAALGALARRRGLRRGRSRQDLHGHAGG
jgi:hypothetical protein